MYKSFLKGLHISKNLARVLNQICPFLYHGHSYMSLTYLQYLLISTSQINNFVCLIILIDNLITRMKNECRTPAYARLIPGSTNNALWQHLLGPGKITQALTHETGHGPARFMSIRPHIFKPKHVNLIFGV